MSAPSSALSNPYEHVAPFVLECGWCGGAAIRKPTNEFQEDEGEACEDCGFPGHVNMDNEGDHAYWWVNDGDPKVVAEWVRTHPITAKEFGYLEPEIEAGARS